MGNIEYLVTTEQLLRFLNDPDEFIVQVPYSGPMFDHDQLKEEIAKTWSALRRCVDLIVTYNNESDTDLIRMYKRKNSIPEKKKIDDKLVKALKWDKAQAIARAIWYDEFDLLMVNAFLEVYPKTAFEKPGNWLDLDVSSVFSPGFALLAHPRHINYILSFINLLSDPKVGLRRLFKCLQCSRICIGRPNQKFCRPGHGAQNCRVNWHYKQDPERKKRQVREWRKKNPHMG